MKTNVTLRIDMDLLKEAKVLAARQGTSLSRMLSETLEEIVRRELAYERAKDRALKRLKRGFDLQWHPAGSRDELYERGK
jgi:predicted transcriptional regulator